VRSLSLTRIACSAFLTSCLIILDLPLELVCIRFSLLYYMIVGYLGYRLGGPVHRRVLKPGPIGVLARIFGLTTIAIGLAGALILSTVKMPWHAKCAWRNCGRILGPGLTESPFPVPEATCSDLHRCANEAHFSKTQLDRLRARLEANHCQPL
jgi:RsiW-degrading membrane proteinase PrsW (M82 family)